jgi:hypothetical protein
MDPDRPPGSFIDSSRFDTLVRTRTWEWLDALSRRLHLDVQLVDPHAHPGLPTNVADQTALARLIASSLPELHDPGKCCGSPAYTSSRGGAGPPNFCISVERPQ